jgi:hypothetical protein
MKIIIVGFVMAVVVVPTMLAQTDAARQAMPIEPITAIVETFRTHQVVVLGEAHRNSADQAFRLSLIRDPRFPTVVNDIVVESGSAAFQDLMDRFMSGEDVPGESLRQVWLNALSPFGAPMYVSVVRCWTNIVERSWSTGTAIRPEGIRSLGTRSPRSERS